MAVYSIGDLEKLSGIKAHTIRMWEQRYDILQPQRTDTNIRYYLDSDLKLLLNIAILNKNGLRISKIAKMSPAEISEQVADISDLNMPAQTQLDALTLSMMEMDEGKFAHIIASNTKQLGFERTMLEVIYPFLEKLSVLWLTGSINPVQENFITSLIRQKVIAAIDSLSLDATDPKHKFLIYLPEGERQELSLLFMQYLVKSRRYYPIYLGQDISVDDLRDACSVHHPKYVFTMITETFAKESVSQYLDRLRSACPNSQILVSGYQVVAQQVRSTDRLQVLESLGEVIDWLNEHQPTATRRSDNKAVTAAAKNSSTKS